MRSSKLLATLAVALALVGPVAAGPGVANGPVHDGTEVDCDLPMSLRIRNKGGTDGQGLCVWASADMMATYANCEPLMGVFQYMRSQRGGGWPERVDEIMRSRCPGVQYRQYLGPDLDFVQEGINRGVPVCVTYGYGELYNMRTIAHMVLCVGLTDRYAAILDNNDPGHVWWMDREEFRRRFTHPGGRQGWAWYVLAPPPPPPPHNGSSRVFRTPLPYEGPHPSEIVHPRGVIRP